MAELALHNLTRIPLLMASHFSWDDTHCFGGSKVGQAVSTPNRAHKNLAWKDSCRRRATSII